jgi:hypothetical protein
MKIGFFRQVIILALLIFFIGMIHVWDLPKNLEHSEVIENLSRESTQTMSPSNSVGALRKLAGEEESEIHQIDCQNLTDLYVKNFRVRLEGKCNLTLAAITNKTNGYTASIFNRESGFTTDYISLSAGKNFIEISIKDDKNQSISRQIPVIVSE